MLAAFYDKEIEQEEIVHAAKVEKKIKLHGMTVEELAQAAKILVPDLKFWLKRNATITELSQLINVFKVPVGVEWQGIFDYPDEEISEDEDDDPGHIAVITYLDTQNNLIKIADPDAHYAGKDRQFSVLQFERRWWDINCIVDGVKKRRYEQDDYHLIFILTPPYVVFPESLRMKRE